MVSHFHQNDDNEILVSLTNLSPKIKVYPYYYHQRYPYALPDCYLREGAAERLLFASKKLPSHLYFVVLDGWRPYELQLFLYEKIRADFLKEGEVENLSKYVSFPSNDIENASPHLTGGAVDLTIASGDTWLNMGTAFDEFNHKAQTDWYENQQELSAEEKNTRNNRRILKQVMEEVDFSNYPEEWWHYDFGNRDWAMSTKNTAIYKGVLKPPLKQEY